MNFRPKKAPGALDVSEGELIQKIHELDELHHDESLPALKSSVEEWIEINQEHAHDPSSNGMISRRGLLVGGSAAAIGGVLLAACSNGKSSSGTTTPTTSTPATAAGAASLTGDLKVAALAASLENLGIYAYGAGIKAATAGKLGSVPPAIVTFATTARAQHTAHAAAWNSALTAAGKSKVTETDPALTPTVNQMFGQVTDVAGLAKLALEIENIAAQTYQSAVSALSSENAVKVAASIHPVEMQHAAILNLVLGNYPVPSAFNPTSSARTTEDLGGS